MTTRGNWQGMWTIVRFNWPFYATAAGVLILVSAGYLLSETTWVRMVCIPGIAVTLYFLAGSLGVSHLVYDRSDLYRWNWLDRALGKQITGPFVLCHSGFDEVSQTLRKKLRGEWIVLDHFDPQRMTEASIRRARKIAPPRTGTISAPHDHWGIADETAEVIFGILAIHELRSESERIHWFTEARRTLKPTGKIVIAEHTRNLANLLAFGPGVLHFHSRKSWRRCWSQANLQLIDSFPITPWVEVFILQSYE